MWKQREEKMETQTCIHGGRELSRWAAGTHGTLAARLAFYMHGPLLVVQLLLLNFPLRAGHAARWARCRNAHLSQFARQVGRDMHCLRMPSPHADTFIKTFHFTLRKNNSTLCS